MSVGTTPSGLFIPANGFLPAGIHRVNRDTLYRLCVASAPHRPRRELLFRALVLYIIQMQMVFPAARCWVDGGFVTHKPDPPKDVDVVTLHRGADLALLDTTQQRLLRSLLTEPRTGYKPLGGLIDGYRVRIEASDQVTYWRDWWARRRGADPRPGYSGSVKGFLEVKW